LILVNHFEELIIGEVAKTVEHKVPCIWKRSNNTFLLALLVYFIDDLRQFIDVVGVLRGSYRLQPVQVIEIIILI